jgi:nucleoid-associated protein YgaU
MITSQRSGRWRNIMTAASTSRMIVPFIAFPAACCIALFFAVQHGLREAPVATKAATATMVALKPAADERDQGPALAAQAKANAMAATLAGSPVAADGSDGTPTFDIARVEPTGEAVIAGRATPGATVEVLRNGERHDRAVADQSGQFVMVPPPLPPGTYDLTLRSRQPDGRQLTSRQSVAVVNGQTAAGRPALHARAELPLDAPATGVAGSAPRQASKRTTAQQSRLAAAGTTLLPEGGSPPSTVAGPRIATVSRGDSLWRISHLTYGAGTRYAVIYKANREQIRNPNLIRPGQIFVIPAP